MLRIFLRSAVAALLFACTPAPVTTTCTAGEKDCACKSDGSCGAGLQCTANKCATIGGGTCASGDLACSCAGGKCIAVAVGDASVRACDVKVSLGDKRLGSITYAANTRGQQVTRDGDVAVSFVSRVDAPFAGAPLAFVLADGSSVKSAIQSSDVKCFDRTGQPVADPKLSFE